MTTPRWRNSIIATVIFAVFVVALLWAIPGLHDVTRELKRATGGWIALAVGLELLSCLSFVVLFARVFSRGPRRFTSRLAWSEMAANSLISAGGTSGLALGAWVLRSRGIPVPVAQRLIVTGFLDEVIQRLNQPAIAGHLHGLVEDKFSA